jgi:hypothetical protein
MNSSPNRSLSTGPSTAGRWRGARRLLVAAAAAATFTAVFYTVENWRGMRAWENCRRELEAKGEVLDWSEYIPAPVPDDQNFYKAPLMREWFVKEHFAIGGTEPPNAPKPFVPAPRKDDDLLLAEVKVVATNAQPDSEPTDAVLRFDAPAAREQAAKLLSQAIGTGVIGAKACVLLARPLNQFKPLHLVLQADPVPTLKEITAFFPSNPLTNLAHASDSSYLQVQSSGGSAFRVYLKAPVYGAADYLAWNEPLTADLDLLRKALERPYARIDCDYQQPFAIGIPNFVRIRNVSQLLSQRAQSCLLLGQPEAAWHELALVHDLCQILQAKPSGKPTTLVGAMINVAVIGLYTGIVEDGLRLHAWREPQLLAIEQQLQNTDLLAPVVEAFREERAATCRTFETTRRSELVKLFNFENPVSRLALAFVPRGWFYQNMAAGAKSEQEVLGSVDLTNRLVLPRRVSVIVRQLSPRSERRSPYRFLVAVALPNFVKALQTAARNQTMVDQARLACALERFRLAQGQYPDALDALTPQFIEKLPHDLIDGHPLKYRRTDGGYLLYSIGWDEKDGGGIPGQSRYEGDWVWELR